MRVGGVRASGDQGGGVKVEDGGVRVGGGRVGYVRASGGEGHIPSYK